jgi:hypothetical protein
MRTSILATVLLLPLALTGCNDPVSARAQQAQRDTYSERETELINGYYGPDIFKAEESLLALSQHYQDAQKAALDTVNYDSLLMLTHARLHLLYSHLRRTNDASIHRDHALKFMRRSALYNVGTKDQGPNENRWEDLIETIDRLDKNREVKWQRANPQ